MAGFGNKSNVSDVATVDFFSEGAVGVYGSLRKQTEPPESYFPSPPHRRNWPYCHVNNI